MTQRATVEQLRKARTRVVTVPVDGEAMEFEIAKLKVGQRKRLQAECVTDDGLLDLEHATRLACEMCVVEPKLSAEDVEEIDIDVFMLLAAEITQHSGMANIQQAATPDPEEGSDAVKGFPAP